MTLMWQAHRQRFFGGILFKGVEGFFGVVLYTVFLKKCHNDLQRQIHPEQKIPYYCSGVFFIYRRWAKNTKITFNLEIQSDRPFYTFFH